MAGGEDTDGPTEQARELPSAIGRFEVRSLAGIGGTSIIYSAWDGEYQRPVAIKLLRHDRSTRRDTQARFLREAKTMARLDHPNIVRIYEVGTHEGQVFLALEYVQGKTLREWVELEQPAVSEIIKRYLDAGRALEAAHAASVMHRDFKPDNVLLGDDGRVRVLDFGLARSTRGTDNFQTLENLTPGLRDALAEGPELLATIGFSGTPAYKSLEQHFGRPTDPRADQFAFCVTVWEALYGERPFAGRSASEIARAIEAGKIKAPPADRSAAVPRRVQSVLQRGLAAERIDRWASMTELLAELEVASRAGLFARLLGALRGD
ncbi:Serine/threonine kinase PKN8 [Enhygromyxa salina]|uniref:Serine/threonine kinase PKN8 n=1 Tax=Enhygromyxa salina TaxID=215803 RepID=A0A0C2CXB7_9BACT|nr:serine/threonine-protein kinase [Enhygromyxa salina]KIG15661.1 Serine/threonine kinase PKN8 [Enhygromyxa salina]